jgi:hypothetical protein
MNDRMKKLLERRLSCSENAATESEEVVFELVKLSGAFAIIFFFGFSKK